MLRLIDSRRWHSAAWLAAGLALLAGCGGGLNTGDVEAVVPVSGTLTYQGKPLENYQVIMMPDDGRRVATGVADAQGHFSMGTNTAGDGAPPGPCKIAIQFAPPDTSEAGNETIIDDPSRLPKPKIKIPPKYADPATSGLAEDIPASGIEELKIDLK